jgi:hypothetical protein
MVHFGDSSEEEGSVRNEDHDDANSDTNDANSDTNDADAAPAPVAPAPQATVVPAVPASPAAAVPAPAAQRRSASRRTAAPAVSSSESVTSQAFNPTHAQTGFFVDLLRTATEQAVGTGIGEDTISALRFALHNMSLGMSVNVSIQGSDATADTATSSRSRSGGPRAGFSKLSVTQRIAGLYSDWSPREATSKLPSNKQIRSRRIYGRYVAEQDVIQGTRLTTRYVDGTESEEDLSGPQETYEAPTPFAERIFKNTTQPGRKISGPKAVKVLFEDGSEKTLEKL